MDSTKKESERRRKTHKKSRRGCRNCKIRRVKCDEVRPKCTKCTDYGVSCNYGDSEAPDLHMSFHGFAAPVFDIVKIPKQLPTPPPVMMANSMPTSFQIDREMIDRLSRFRARTVLSMGNKEMASIYQKEAIELAFRAPYMMHILQTITMLHDSYLSGNIFSKSLVDEISSHWTKGISLFSRKLASPIQEEDRDPLWATAALSGIVAFAAIDATTPEDAWPLKHADESDLGWLRLTVGKSAVFELTNPMRQDSVFHTFLQKYFIEKMKFDINVVKGPGYSHKGQLKGPGIENLPWQFIDLYELDGDLEYSPYRNGLHELGKILPIECTVANVIDSLGFLSHISQEYQALLEIKDDRALLLLAFWYAKVCNTPIWWMDRRATIECRSICLYLERNSTDMRVLELLDFPRNKCGLEGSALTPPYDHILELGGLDCVQAFNYIKSY